MVEVFVVVEPVETTDVLSIKKLLLRCLRQAQSPRKDQSINKVSLVMVKVFLVVEPVETTEL